MENATLLKRIAHLMRADKSGRLLVKLHSALFSEHLYGEFRAESCFTADDAMFALDDALCDLEEALDYDYELIRSTLRDVVNSLGESALANKGTTFTYLAHIYPIFGRSMINKMYAEDPDDRKLKFLYIYPMMCAALVDCHPESKTEESRKRVYQVYKELVALSKRPSKFLKRALTSEYFMGPIDEDVVIREVSRTI